MRYGNWTGPSELTPVQFSERHVPSELAAGLDYVLLSYYPTQCGGRMPSSGEVAAQLATTPTEAFASEAAALGQ